MRIELLVFYFFFFNETIKILKNWFGKWALTFFIYKKLQREKEKNEKELVQNNHNGAPSKTLYENHLAALLGKIFLFSDTRNF